MPFALFLSVLFAYCYGGMTERVGASGALERKRGPVLTGAPLSLSTRCVLPGSDSLLPQAAHDCASLSAWSSRRALAFRYCFCFPCPPRLESICTLTWRGFVSAFLGRKMRSTPSRLCAVTFPISTVEGSVNLLAKAP
jgi:hypothetical protein